MAKAAAGLVRGQQQSGAHTAQHEAGLRSFSGELWPEDEWKQIEAGVPFMDDRMRAVEVDSQRRQQQWCSRQREQHQ